MPEIGNSSVFSQTDGSNNSGTMPSWSGSAAPSTLDDAGRAFQGAVTREWNWRNFTLTAAGTADAKTLTYSVAPAAYYSGQRFAFIANTTNTGSATLNVNSLGAKTIKKDVSGTLTNLSASDMVSGMFVEVSYNTANDCFVWVNRGAISSLGTASTYNIGTSGANVPLLNGANTWGAAQTVAAASGSTQFQAGTAANGYFSVTAFDSNPVYCLVAGANATVATFGAQTNIPVSFFQNNAEAARIDTSKNLLMTSTGGLGYGTGSGGSVTQITSRTTGVTLNKTNGQITLFSTTTSAGDYRSFTVTNSTVAATDTVIVNIASGASADKYIVTVTAVAAGSFRVQVYTSMSVGSAEAPVLNFAVIKAVNA